MITYIQNFLQAWKLPRWRWALVIALLSDGAGFLVAPMPPVQWLVDAITAVLLFAALGFRWSLLSVLAIEVVPGLQVLPFWTLMVLALAGTQIDSAPPIVEVAGNARSKNRTNELQNRKLKPS